MNLDVKRSPDDDCLKCGLYETCKSPIMNGYGPEDPIWEFVGEAPGGTEDDPKFGQPFVGQAGQFLKKVLEDCGIPIEKCRLTNAIRCRPPNNKLEPYPKAWEYCKPKILREIHVTKPKVVVLLGAVALRSVLGKKGVTKLHGETFTDEEHGRVYVVCLHPSYILKNLTEASLRKFISAISLAARLGGVKLKGSKSVKATKWDYIRDKKMLYEYTDLLRKRDKLATDIEGSTLSAYHPEAKVGCVGFSWEFGYSIVYPVHARQDVKVKVKPEEVMEAVKDIWTDEGIEISAHFGKYDEGYVNHLYQFKIANYKHDTGLASYANDAVSRNHKLKEWMLRLGGDAYWDRKKREYFIQHPEADPEQGGNSNLVPGSILYPYNGEDCSYTFKLESYLIPILKERHRYKKPFLFPLMYHNQTAEYLEDNGLALDMDKNEFLLEEFPNKIAELEEEIKNSPEYSKLLRYKRRMAMENLYRRVKKYKKQPVSVRTKVLQLYDQLLERMKEKGEELVTFTDADKRILFFDILDLPIIEETPTGMASVRTEVLDKIPKKPKVLLTILKRTEHASAFSKYVEPVKEWRGVDGRTHTSYLVHGQVTGRVGSEKPNHENLIKRGDKWVVENIREQFVATPSEDDDYLICKADEKQIEMRLFADRAQDKAMIKEFNEGKDPHAMGAMTGFLGDKLRWEGKVWRYFDEEGWVLLPKELIKSLRDRSKSAISFGLLYGRSAMALAVDMQWSLRKAQRFIDKYFGKYWGCKNYIEAEGIRLCKVKYSKSHYGRIREIPDVDSDNEAQVAAAIREGINAPIQGDASDIAWGAGWRMMTWLKKHKMRTKIIIIEHDALYLDLFRREAHDVFPKLLHYMTDRDWIYERTGWYCSVPLDIDIAGGRHLAQKLDFKRKEDTFLIPEELAA